MLHYVYTLALSNMHVLIAPCVQARAFSFAYGGIKAGVSMHDRLLASVAAAPMAFFHTTSQGRLLNRSVTLLMTMLR